MNNCALITGSTAGIGYELAKTFAARKFDLILVARNQKRLDELATELKAKHGVEIKVLTKDLAASEAAREIFDSVRDIPVSVLVNNAGFGAYGPFAKTELALQTDMVQVNILALMQLTHLFLQPMLARSSGRILNVASTAAFQPGPNMNVYYATKAFVYSFSYALADELQGTGITVTATERRSQHANREAAFGRLRERLEELQRVETPRKPTRPTAASRERRVSEKRISGLRKKLRSAPVEE